MLSIGEIAHRTGVSRRMLRHWEQEGLLSPALVDPVTGYRRFQDTQLGRIRAIAELRDLGFSLSEIRQLLDPQIAHSSLERILMQQADTLRDQITEASARLAQVQHRVDTIQKKAQEISMNLSLTPLPELSLQGASTTVLDETDIGSAVARLRDLVPHDQGDLILLFDGTSPDQITVTAATADGATTPGLQPVSAPLAPQGATVTFPTPPSSVADAWVLIDAELEKRGLASGGVYRQIISPDGSTTLQAAVHARG